MRRRLKTFELTRDNSNAWTELAANSRFTRFPAPHEHRLRRACRLRRRRRTDRPAWPRRIIASAWINGGARTDPYNSRMSSRAEVPSLIAVAEALAGLDTSNASNRCEGMDERGPWATKGFH